MTRKSTTLTLGLLGLLATLAVGPTPLCAAPEDRVDEDADRAPTDCWPMPDGCPGRTATTDTVCPKAPLEQVWAYEPMKSAIVGEPLVWKSLVVVPFSDGFDVLDLATGSVIASKRKLAKDVNADPVMGPGFVLARTAVDRLEAFTIDIAAKSAKSAWTWKCPDGEIVTKPLVRGRDVTVFSNRAAYRLHVGRPPDPLDATPIEAPPVGEPSIIGGELLWVTEKLENSERVVSVAGSNGRVPTFIGLSGDGDAGSFVDSYRIVGRPMGEVFVVTRHGLKNAKGGVSTTASTDYFYLLGRDAGLASFVRVPVLWKKRWVIADRNEEGALELAFTVDPDAPQAKKDRADAKGRSLRWNVLASPKQAPHLASVGVPATGTNNAILIGAYAFDPSTHEVLYELPVSPAFRAVPARGTVLIVEGDAPRHGRRLLAYRTRRSVVRTPTIAYAPAPPIGNAANAPIRLEELTCVRRDGLVRTGSVAWKPGDDTISFPPPPPKVVPGAPPPAPTKPVAAPRPDERWALSDVALIVDKDRHVLHGGDPDDVIAAMRRVAESSVAKDWLGHAAEAIKKVSAGRARAALALAESHGASDADVWRVTGEIDALERKSRTPLSSDEKVLATKEAAIRAKVAGTMWGWAAGLPKDAPLVLTARLARIALETDPSTEGPSAWTRANVPQGIAAGAAFATREWLDFLDALNTTPVRIVEVPPVEKNLTNSQRQLGAARYAWRKDLVAFESKRAVVITHVDRPGRIARCLATAELVCRTLESMFEEYRKKRAETDPLVMILFDSKEEYLRRSNRESADDGLEWTGGHYSPSDGVSRLFVPDGDEEFQSVVATFAHELTHHWMDLCCPAFSDADRVKRGKAAPGYWIEEGFARFIEEGRFDLKTGEFDLDSSVAASVDVVANAEPSQLVPWKWLLTTAGVDFSNREMTKAQHQIPMRLRLGFHRLTSPMEMFYDQSAATTRWLWFGDGGARRKLLLEFVASFHANRTEADTLTKLLGMSYEEIGAKVVAWAKERQRRPTK